MIYCCFFIFQVPRNLASDEFDMAMFEQEFLFHFKSVSSLIFRYRCDCPDLAWNENIRVKTMLK